jgi:hypothetical protein
VVVEPHVSLYDARSTLEVLFELRKPCAVFAVAFGLRQ